MLNGLNTGARPRFCEFLGTKEFTEFTVSVDVTDIIISFRHIHTRDIDSELELWPISRLISSREQQADCGSLVPR